MATDAEVLELTRVLPGTPDEVYRAWTEPGVMARWMSPIGTARAEVDLRVGGRLRVVMIGGGMEISHAGEFLEVDPPTRLSFTWRSEHTADRDTIVTVTLEARGEGTLLRLRHERLTREEADSHGQGWGRMLDRLAAGVAA